MQRLEVCHYKSSIQEITLGGSLQICGRDVCLYISAYTSTSTDTLEVIAQVVRSKEHSIKIQMMNAAQQTRTTEMLS